MTRSVRTREKHSSDDDDDASDRDSDDRDSPRNNPSASRPTSRANDGRQLTDTGSDEDETVHRSAPSPHRGRGGSDLGLPHAHADHHISGSPPVHAGNSRQECSEIEAEVTNAPLGPEAVHEATGLNVMTHCVECRSKIRPLLEAKARTRYCRVTYAELTEGFKGYCACHGRRDHGRTSGKRRMVFRKDNFSIANGWEPSHGAIAAYRAAKKVRAPLGGPPSPQHAAPPRAGAAPPHNVLGWPLAPALWAAPPRQEWHAPPQPPHRAAPPPAPHDRDGDHRAPHDDRDGDHRAPHAQQQHDHRAPQPHAASAPWYFSAPPAPAPVIVDCAPAAVIWSDCVQPELSIAHFPESVTAQCLVVSVALGDGAYRRATLLALPRFARSRTVRFAVLDSKEQLFYDFIEDGGPAQPVEATLTVVFSEGTPQQPALTKEAGIVFLPSRAANRAVHHAQPHAQHAPPHHAPPHRAAPHAHHAAAHAADHAGHRPIHDHRDHHQQRAHLGAP
ncbi:hypothetical protein M885DRAFT_613870 [Pelagophyceae sp. CCMP2097]|nr:hypothetical protein M885DRAFT_613870 [Pelagophyceae sp. CCMP2097]